MKFSEGKKVKPKSAREAINLTIKKYEEVLDNIINEVTMDYYMSYWRGDNCGCCKWWRKKGGHVTNVHLRITMVILLIMFV